MTNDPFIGWPGLLARLLAGDDVGAVVAGSAITEILRGDATPSQMTAFVVAMRAKGETAGELEGMLRAVREAGNRVDLPADVAARAIDIVGTGGDKSYSVNVSTMAALVVAGAGVPVSRKFLGSTAPMRSRRKSRTNLRPSFSISLTRSPMNLALASESRATALG